ncbi:hypothetical protein JB92DRAFT_2991697 [Gautieria morchelliformis]|nr:hypothetical protein JB92DRAFT_2991697 [Gautieria morchelliformis]
MWGVGLIGLVSGAIQVLVTVAYTRQSLLSTVTTTIAFLLRGYIAQASRSKYKTPDME